MLDINNFINNETLYYLRNYFFITIIGIICSTTIVKKFIEKLNKSNNWSKILEVIIYMLILFLCTANLVSDTFNPFLYFRF